MSKKTVLRDPVEIAAHAADQYIARLFSNLPGDSEHRDTDDCPLDEAIEQISEHFTADYVRVHGPIRPDDDGGVIRGSIGTEAGYIVGLQVGRRLAGGAR
jgi:hypothetical protein